MSGKCMAAVDIGTNSCRLLVADQKGKSISPVLKRLRVTRIGEGAAKQGLLGERPMERTITALREYSALIKEFQVAQLHVVATDAVRQAANAAFFLEQVREETGFAVDVISGGEEARLNYIGACQMVAAEGTGVVVDIGGGSTEFTFSIRDEGLNCYSIPLGAVRLTEEPCLLSEILDIAKEILNRLKKLSCPALIGVGGTITSLATVDQALEVYEAERVQGYFLTRNAVERIMFSLAAKNNEERKSVPGLQPERADIIIAGTTILWSILTYLGASGITVSDADLLHGIILEML
ncbi:MAG: Ppx/GppA phosphatase family protein [Syntrophaceticus sp.]|nr:Ppx/GppA phosphatase family protein [Syntrophaceticus sp.]MDD4783902.1 Ppx/GppA phosphatase family protein [Syntrophaceticus sp.]